MTTDAVSALTSLLAIVNWDGTSQDIEQALTTAFDAEDYRDCIKDLRGRNIEPLSYINSLDKVRSHSIRSPRAWFTTDRSQIIDSLPTGSELRKRCLQALRKTCGIYGILPTSHVVPFTLSKPGIRPFAIRGSSDIWKLTDEKNQDQVFAVRSYRMYERDPVERIYKVA